MSGESLYKKSLREQVYERLYEEITAPDSYAGKRLAPVTELAKKLGTSVRTIQLALDQLDAEGYIQRKHGVGTFVARQAPALDVTDQVVVAMRTHDEVWSVLASKIVRELHLSGRVPISIDMAHADSAALLHRAARGKISTFIVYGGRGFPFDLLKEPAFREKQIIAVEEWASPLQIPNIYQVLDDYAYGGQQLAEYLWKLGHRRVIIVATESSLAWLNRDDDVQCGASRGRAFVDYWTRHGGTWVGLPTRHTANSLSGIDVDLGVLFDELTALEPATAVFGYRDVEAWTVQSLLHRHRPDLLKKVEIVGYGDTFWSRAARPPITTVAYPVEDMVQWVRQLFDTKSAADLPADARRVMVRPQLVERNRGPQPSAEGPAAARDNRSA